MFSLLLRISTVVARSDFSANKMDPRMFLSLVLFAGVMHFTLVHASDSTGGNQEQTIAFQVGLDRNIGDPTEDLTVPYNVIRLNLGDGFDPVSYHFKAPVTGLYSITYCGLSWGSGSMYLALMHNQQRVSIAFGNGALQAACNSEVMILSKGDAVYTSLLKQSTTGLNDHSNGYNTFGGHLITRFQEETIAFQVGLNRNIGDPAEDLTVPYNVIRLNLGDGFDPVSYHFRAPVRGLYSITYCGLSLDSGSMYLALMHNQQRVSIGFGNGAYQAACNSEVMILSEGDAVYTSLLKQSTTGLNDHSNGYNTFGGYLITTNV